MRFYIKTFFRKLISLYRYPKLLYPGTSYFSFPEKPVSALRIGARIRGLKSELKDRTIPYNLGAMYTLPHKTAVDAYKKMLEFNPNHLGNWSDKPMALETQRIEHEVVKKMIHLYGAGRANVEGYLTSGGTEGNMFSLWMGRTYLEKYSDRGNICLVKTDLTHYSVEKSARIAGVDQFPIPLDRETWGMSSDGLRKKIEFLITKGYRGFLIPLTIGYTSTGTSDDLELIAKTVSQIEAGNKNTKFFLWIDAALNGLIDPFIYDFKPFRNPAVSTIVADFHKFGMVPYSSGIVLYRKKLGDLISRPIDYLDEEDSTLLGSRTGIPAVVAWTMIQSLGKVGYRKLVSEQMKNKNYLISELRKFTNLKIVTDTVSLSCGVVFSKKDRGFPEWLASKYWLYPGRSRLLFHPERREEFSIYKMFFLPHVKLKVLKEFISDVKKAHL